MGELYEDGTVTVAEAEQFSGLGRTTLYALMESGELPHTKIGTRRLIPRRALVNLLAKGCESTGDEKRARKQHVRKKGAVV
jgi:excisionase family DNA binding protein